MTNLLKPAFPVLALAAAAVLATPAIAQRDPAYAQARAAGQVGEQIDGYLGTVGSQPQAIRDLVADINIKRRANYTSRAQAQNATIEEYAFTQGCVLIARTDQGEKYETPGGGWATRGGGAPARDQRCP